MCIYDVTTADFITVKSRLLPYRATLTMLTEGTKFHIPLLLLLFLIAIVTSRVQNHLLKLTMMQKGVEAGVWHSTSLLVGCVNLQWTQTACQPTAFQIYLYAWQMMPSLEWTWRKWRRRKDPVWQNPHSCIACGKTNLWMSSSQR